MLIAGDRAAGDIVRQAAERAEVAASFAGLQPAALAWLESQAIEHGDELVVRRVIGADGRSRAFINGQVVPLQALRELGELLIGIHGQQEFQHLVKRSAQRELLDEHLGAPGLVPAVAEIHARHRACRRDCRDGGAIVIAHLLNKLGNAEGFPCGGCGLMARVSPGVGVMESNNKSNPAFLARAASGTV